MGKKRLITTDKLCKSILYDYNIYHSLGYKVPFLNGDDILIANHLDNNETYYLQRFISFDDPERFIAKWRYFMSCKHNDFFLWPIDIATFDNGLSEEFYMVYSGFSVSSWKSMADHTQKIGFLESENNPLIKKIAEMLCLTFMNAEKEDLLVFGLDDDCIFINDCENVLCLFNPMSEFGRDKKISFTPEDYFSEVIDPYSYRNREINSVLSNWDKYEYDRYSESFSFASMLFHLLVGLYPFEGPSISGFVNNHVSHKNLEWIYAYLKTPVFVLDQDDSTNSIMVLNRYHDNIKRWESLSDDLKLMFASTFSQEALNRGGSFESYSYAEWYAAVIK